MTILTRAKLHIAVASAAVLLTAVLLLQQLSAAESADPGLQASQRAVVARALSDLQPSDGVPHLYFVGFAGYGAEAVFKREVLAVRGLFDERFGTAGRSIALVNHASTASNTPLASAGNLEQVLGHLGSIMDAERDTLFLFLTSHGEPALLVVEMPGLELEHLTPVALKRMLDRSGIRNRIVVISACHSGSFIPALADPRTLVIAAARADRASFGCSDKRRWTYFGDAYFNRALRRETSFRKAFERARKLVERWEARERLVPSLPQMLGGEALALAD